MISLMLGRFIDAMMMADPVVVGVNLDYARH
jgi:hypothetical protein